MPKQFTLAKSDHGRTYNWYSFKSDADYSNRKSVYLISTVNINSIDVISIDEFSQ